MNRGKLKNGAHLLLWIVAAAPCTAQTPLVNEFVVTSKVEFHQSQHLIVCDDQSDCLLTWMTSPSAEAGIGRFLSAKTLSARGEVLSEKELRPEDNTLRHLSSGLADGFFLTWDKAESTRRIQVFQIFDHELNERSVVTEMPFTLEHGTLTGLVRVPKGYALLLQGEDLPASTSCENYRAGVFLLFIGEDGHLLREPQRVNERPDFNEQVSWPIGSIAKDRDGNLIATFWRSLGSFYEKGDVYVRLFSPEGQPLGPEIRANASVGGDQRDSQVAAFPDGGFVVVWNRSPGPQGGDYYRVYGRRFSAAGSPIGPEFLISEDEASIQTGYPQIAVDRAGNFVVIWRYGHPWPQNGIPYESGIRARLFRPNGVPVTRAIRVNQESRFPEMPNVAFAPNGTFLVGWAGFIPSTPETFTDPYARRFAASPGEEPCAVAGGKLLCDTGRTGGFPELQLTFGGRPGEVTLLGDYDGDGREEVCAWFKGRFRCDLDHEGAPAEAKVDFGLPTDVPLMGDVDGDGRAEACVRRKRRLLCDTGHDGGRPETTIILGRGTEVPMLGDLDGDHRDDLCLFSQGKWDCLTRAGARLAATFGNPGDVPALGDLNRDSRADLCVLRGSGMLLCDTARDGGAAEAELSLELPPGARPLFGNLDGL